MKLPPLSQNVQWLDPDGSGSLSIGPHRHGFGGKFVFIDTETTGKTRDDVVISIGYLFWKNGAIAARKKLFLNPEGVWGEPAARIHCIPREAADAFPPPRAGLSELLDILPENAVLVGYNTGFDRFMLRRMFRRHGLGAPRWLLNGPQIDTCIWSRRFNLPLGLVRAVAKAGCPVYRAHDAMTDCVMTCNLWARLLDAFIVKRKQRIK